jgi:hypothetical protein
LIATAKFAEKENDMGYPDPLMYGGKLNANTKNDDTGVIYDHAAIFDHYDAQVFYLDLIKSDPNVQYSYVRLASNNTRLQYIIYWTHSSNTPTLNSIPTKKAIPANPSVPGKIQKNDGQFTEENMRKKLTTFSDTSLCPCGINRVACDYHK